LAARFCYRRSLRCPPLAALDIVPLAVEQGKAQHHLRAAMTGTYTQDRPAASVTLMAGASCRDTRPSVKAADRCTELHQRLIWKTETEKSNG